MDFCPLCRKILVLGEWKGKQVGKCACGFIRTSGLIIEKEIENKPGLSGVGVAEKNNINGINFLCKKCGHNRADAKELGEILNNERSVTLFTCLGCGNVQRT